MPLNRQTAVALVLDDLARAGVTDLVGETPRTAGPLANPFHGADAPQRAAPQAPAATRDDKPVPAPRPQQGKPAITPAAAPVAAVQVDVAACLQWLPAAGAKLVVITHFGCLPGTAPALPLSTEEGVLFSAMLKAIGFDMACVSWLVLTGPLAALGAQPPGVGKAIETLLAANAATTPVLAIGQQALSAAFGRQSSLHMVREAGAETLNTPTTAPAGATYHPQVLLEQPLLKRQAWADLLSFQQRLRTIVA